MADLLATASVGNARAAAAVGGATANDGAVLGLSRAELDELKEQAISWAAAHGMLVRWKAQGPNGDHLATFTHIPFCLLPVPLPKAQFEHGVALSPVYGKLVDRVSRDLEWLHRTLESVVHEDKFTARLLALSKQIEAEGIQQKAYLGIHRSDYMLHEPQAGTSGGSQRLLQVELNAISSSFGCISSLTSQLHSYLVGRAAVGLSALETHYQVPLAELSERMPKNDAILELPNALAAAHAHYGVKDAIIVFVVQPNEANSIDQRWIEYNLWTIHGVRVIRKTMAEMNVEGTLEDREGKRILKVEGQEVAVAYYRSAYTPNDYPTEQEWEGRVLIERSYAIKCPSIAYHLAGTKKVQQALADPAALRRFVSDSEATLLETSFAGLWGLEKESEATRRVKAMATENPRSYVLKPQREGGGNNLYGDEVAAAMQRMSPIELESYILMERIFPNENAAILVRNGLTASGNTISELGMFITSLFDDGNEILNKHAGHLLRTKLSGTDEGGVATGFSVVSSPLLCERVPPLEKACARVHVSHEQSCATSKEALRMLSASNGDDDEVLQPSRASTTRHVLMPFRRSREIPAEVSSANANPSRLKVVYDQRFDRFFLAGTETTLQVASLSPTRARPRATPSKKRGATRKSEVQWEDLILPPKSVSKVAAMQAREDESARREESNVSDSEGGPARCNPGQDTDSSDAASTAAAVAATAITTEATEATELKSSRSEGASGSAVELLRSQQHFPNEDLATTTEAQARESVAMPGPEISASELGCQQFPVVAAKEAGDLTSADPVEVKPADASVSAVVSVALQEQFEQCATDTSASASAGTSESTTAALVSSPPPAVDMQPQQNPSTMASPAPRTKLESANTVLCAVRRYVQRQQKMKDGSNTSSATAKTADTLQSSHSSPAAAPVIEQPSLVPADATQAQPVEASCTSSEVLTALNLQLDLSTLADPASRAPASATMPSRRRTGTSIKSPSIKSPKKARVPSYAEHFARANNQSVIRVEDQEQHEVRWNGEVIHVSVAPVSHSLASPYPSLPQRSTVRRHAEDEIDNQLEAHGHELAHVFEMTQLARIRPHADGFRRVNDVGCTFTALTSSSESSESEEDQLEIAPSSSDSDDGPHIEFQRGDGVLCYARHRWFKGTVLRRIKKSDFYDVKAANGSVLEAIPVRRLRHFDGADEDAKPRYRYEKGDRVLWRPHENGKTQTYKARILSIRSFHKRFDLELRTGRVVKKVPYDELQPRHMLQ